MKIALIITSFEGELPTFSTKPYGLLSLSAYLKSKNIISDVYDFTELTPNKVNIIESIYKFGLNEYDIIGFSSYFENYESSKHWAHEIKNINSNVHITIGGYCPTIAHDYIVKTDFCFDSAIRGYGEMAIYQLCIALRGQIEFKDVSNLTYLSSSNEVTINKFIEFEDLDEIGIINEIQVKNKEYNYETIFDDKDNLWRTKIPIIASRGCPFPCFFCLNRVITKKYTVSPLDLVIQEIEAAIHGYENTIITFWDPNFLIKEDLFMGILNYLNQKKIPFTFGTTVSQLLKNKNRLNSFVELGLRAIEVGIENVNDDINKIELGKVQSARDCWELIELLSKNINCVVDFINYTAKSELKHIKNNIDFLKYYFNIYPLQEYYDFSSFESQLCYYVGSKSFELLQKDIQFEFIPTKIYYSSDYFFNKDVGEIFRLYRKFREETLFNLEEYYSEKFKEYEYAGTLNNPETQIKLKEIRDIPFYWYQAAFDSFEKNFNNHYEYILKKINESNPSYSGIFKELISYNPSP